jgi:murein L,D-transpeptidase YafK
MRALLFSIAFLLAVVPTDSDAATVPSSARSEKAIARVRPALESALHAQGLRYGDPIFIRIFKESSELELWVQAGDRFALFRTYKVCYYSGDLGPKLQVGDNQSPEGFYSVWPRQLNPNSRFHLSFNLGYPNAYDRTHGRTGDALMVHGSCVSIGCYAMTDRAIEEIYAMAATALGNGQRFFQVHVFPFRLTPETLSRHKGSRWYDFWQNLREGYELFEKSGRPPNVSVKDKRYVFAEK